jgi:hypothetical protein
MKAELKETEWNVVDLISVQQDREFWTSGKILKYLRKCNLLQEDPDTLRELANGPERSDDWAELRNCTWRRLFRISGSLTIVKTFKGLLGSCSWMHFNVWWPLSYFSI